MSREIYERFREIVPLKKLSSMKIDEIVKSCKVAFDIIGYTAQDFPNSFKTTWRHHTTDVLFEFVFDVYMEDKK